MLAEDFNAILEERLAKTKVTLASKAEEYATGADRLHNFKAAAKHRGINPADSLAGMLVKHWVSIEDMVDLYELAEECGTEIKDAVINEKIGDAINYLCLLEALLKERNILHRLGREIGTIIAREVNVPKP